jgi:hypothetical protein
MSVPKLKTDTAEVSLVSLPNPTMVIVTSVRIGKGSHPPPNSLFVSRP